MWWRSYLIAPVVSVCVGACGDASDEAKPTSGGGCFVERWPGPTSVLRSYACTFEGEWATCDCDGVKQEAAIVAEGNVNACLALLAKVCGVPPQNDFCRSGEEVCWGEDGEYQCLCEGSQTLVPSTGAAGCWTHLQNRCEI